MNRRDFLRRTGWVAAGITVMSSCSWVPAIPTGLGDNEDALSWLRFDSDGRLYFYCPRSEMGQGIDSGLSLIIAEELWLAPDLITCLTPSTADIAPVQSTVGSQSMQNYLQPTAQVAANMREQLRALAAMQLGIAKSQLQLSAAGFTATSGQQISYKEIIRQLQKPMIITQLESVELRYKTHSKYIGKNHPMQQGRDIVTGKTVYARDCYLPDMRFGAVIKPPYLGAELLSYEKQLAEQTPGVIAVVMGPQELPGVVAQTPMALRQGLQQLQCEWRDATPEHTANITAALDIDQAIAKEQLNHQISDSPNQQAADLDLRFDTPMMAHAPLEPRAGLARYQNGKCEVWGASQDPFFVQRYIAKLLDLNSDDVTFNNHRLGGAFGGRILCQASVEAAWLSAAIKQPVKVQWSREQEFAYNYVGPQFSHRIKISLDSNKKIAHWQHQFMASPIMISSVFIPKAAYPVVDLIADKGVQRGALPAYNFNHQISFGSIRTAMPTGAWRGLGAAPNTFAVERAMDTAAKHSQQDPIQFRLAHSSNARYNHVIQQAKQLSQWQDQPGYGFAACIYKEVTYVAVVAVTEVVVQQVRVKTLYCTLDCGRVISPDRVKAQVEGNLCWGISMALHEQFTLEKGIARTNNFNNYTITKQTDMPEMIIQLINSEEAPSGAGEAAFAPTAAAIANSLSDINIQRLPIKLQA